MSELEKLKAAAEDQLKKRWQELLSRDDILNVSVANKIKDGKDTGIPAVVVFVRKKRPVGEIPPTQILPHQLENTPIDVIELAPSTWKPGKTSMNTVHPEVQRRLAGGVIPRKRRKLYGERVTSKSIFVEVDYLDKATPVQNQGNCGFCTCFGSTAVWEAVLGDGTKLSELHLASCSGTTCAGGNTVEAVLNQAKNGVCLESCCPYVAHDITCGSELCANWWLQAKKLASWEALTALTDMRDEILLHPLVTTMAVHNSFFSYTGGVYKSLSNGDPIEGYHCVAVLGASDTLGAWLIKNSWGLDWGQDCCVKGKTAPGYVWIAYGDSEIDSEMYPVVPSSDPVPAPSPSPSPAPAPCWFGGGMVSLMNWVQAKRGRPGRFFYK